MEENNLKGAGKTPGTADQAETPQTPHKRRVRYKGTHPRSYKEKYKELQPENTGIPLQRSLVRAVHLQVCIFLLW